LKLQNLLLSTSDRTRGEYLVQNIQSFTKMVLRTPQ